MLDPEAITNLLELLTADRRTLAVYLRQRAELGVLAPSGVFNGIADACAEIGRMKGTLRAGRVTCSPKAWAWPDVVP